MSQHEKNIKEYENEEKNALGVFTVIEWWNVIEYGVSSLKWCLKSN